MSLRRWLVVRWSRPWTVARRCDITRIGNNTPKIQRYILQLPSVTMRSGFHFLNTPLFPKRTEIGSSNLASSKTFPGAMEAYKKLAARGRSGPNFTQWLRRISVYYFCFLLSSWSSCASGRTSWELGPGHRCRLYPARMSISFHQWIKTQKLGTNHHLGEGMCSQPLPYNHACCKRLFKQTWNPLSNVTDIQYNTL